MFFFKRKKKELIIPDSIRQAVDDSEAALAIPEKVMKNICLAFALEPIPNKKGCTTRYYDLKPTLTLELLVAAGVNSSMAYMHLANYCLESKAMQGCYRFLLEAVTYSKWARDGGKVNQGMLEFTVPIVATQMLYDPNAEKDPFELLKATKQKLKETSREDVEYLIKAKQLANIYSNVNHKYPIKVRQGANNVFDYYESELLDDEMRDYPTGLVHNSQFIDEFKDIAFMLDVFNKSESKFCSRVVEAYDALLEKQGYNSVGKGVVADLVSSMLYLIFSYSKGRIIVR